MASHCDADKSDLNISSIAMTQSLALLSLMLRMKRRIIQRVKPATFVAAQRKLSSGRLKENSLSSA